MPKLQECTLQRMTATLAIQGFPRVRARLLRRPAWLAAILLFSWLPALSYLDHLPPPAVFDLGGGAIAQGRHAPNASGSTVPHGPTTASHHAHGHGDSGGLGSSAVLLIIAAATPSPELPAPVLAAITTAKHWAGRPAVRPPTPPPR